MAKFEMLDADEHAFVRKPRPVGWFAAGVILIAALGFVLGVYLPLSQAHETLLSTHEELAKKSSDLDQALKKKSENLDDTESRRADLEAFVTSAREKEQSLENRVEQFSATVNDQLKIYFKSKLVTVTPSKEDVKITIDEKILFRPKSSTISPQAKRPVCGIAKSLAQEKDWTVRIRSRAPGDDKAYWETAGARASGLADLLENGCGVKGTQILATAEHLSAGATGEKEVEFVVGPREPLRLRGQDAPLK